jgi:hypothetical protein
MTAGQDRVAIEVWDFVSSDGSVVITAEEFAELERQCPSIRDVRRMVRAACRGWLMRVPERRRKQMLIQWLLEKAETMRPPKPRRPSGTRKPQYARQDIVFEADDGTTRFTYGDIETLSRRCPNIADPLGMIVHLCSTAKFERTIPSQRARSAMTVVDRFNREAEEKKPKVVVEQQKLAQREALSRQVRDQNRRIEEASARADACVVDDGGDNKRHDDLIGMKERQALRQLLNATATIGTNSSLRIWFVQFSPRCTAFGPLRQSSYSHRVAKRPE